jgi:hypothetical protein
MTTIEYLQNVLAGQELKDDSEELKELQQHRKDVEQLLRDGFPESSPTIRYGGSKAKGTLIREAYDLDIACYFLHDDTSSGANLKEIYENVNLKLAEKYYITPKTSALRLMSRDPKDFSRDFHIDVVPGRYVDDSKSDCFLHQNLGDKERLKTNLDVHIEHVKNSGVLPAIRLLKLWKARRTPRVKQFVFELLIIEILMGKKDSMWDKQLEHFWTELKEDTDPVSICDPANPSGNDLFGIVKSVWPELKVAATATLDLIERQGWEAVFGPVESDDPDSKTTEKLKRAASVVIAPTKPWLPEL